MSHKQSEDNSWITGWIEVWGNSIVKYAFSIVLSESVAQDISQEAFRRLNKAHKQDPSHVFDPAWLFSVTRTLAIGRIESRRAVFVNDDEREANSRNTLPVWHQIDPLDREAVWLFYYQRWPIKRIALHSNQSVEEVRSRLFRTQQRLDGLT
ncbi:MAG: hypothetical protein C7B46_18565 [Sulfobacillus benefaciens]|uniref:RNA polymerase sigma-70 region 2 domain-containing protein n=1 Tax=Sulfobacillus benefaciens TaxID=453960 RepID=A0A2T2X4Z8_9FIRM|nr:MAG: hypothetical protein C7B46_18565 [Sulfobacillus benefaciens]